MNRFSYYIFLEQDSSDLFCKIKKNMERIRYLSIILVLLLFFRSFSTTLLTAPRFFVPITLIQPDGEIIHCFASGDEYYNWVHDKDNFTIIENRVTGYYVYAALENGNLISTQYIVGKVDPKKLNLTPGLNITNKRKTEFRNNILKKYYKENATNIKSGSVGIINNLVVFIRFSDESFFASDVNISRYDSLFNLSNFASLYNYYQEVSYKQLTINSTFYPRSSEIVLSYQDTHPRSYYMPFHSTKNPDGYIQVDTNDPWGSTRKDREFQLLSDALKSIKSQIPSDLNLDANSDNRVDNVCFIISGAPTAWSTLLWPHRWDLSSQNIYINDKLVSNFNLQVNSMADVSTLCHEVFHTLGAPDLYHYSEQSVIDPCGVWDIMDYGSGHMSAYMKWQYGGWIPEIPEIKESGTYTLSSSVSSPNCIYKIKSTLSESEYFVVEYRRKSGFFESSIPDNGLLIYRINSDIRGNSWGPPDEIYLFRPFGTLTQNGIPELANFNQNKGRYLFNRTSEPFCFMTDGSLGDLNISVGIPINPTKSTSTISFSVNLPAPLSEYTTSMDNYSWIDISKTGKKITNWHNGPLDPASSLDDGYIPVAIPLGFSFKFFSQYFDSIYIGINGLVSFSQRILNSAAQSGSTGFDSVGFYDSIYTWPGNTVFPNSIAVSYLDFDLTHGNVYYETINNKFIVTWENIGSFAQFGDTLNSFQLILDKNTNLITIQIKELSQLSSKQSVKIGVQKNSLVGSSWVNSGKPPERIPGNKTAITFTPVISNIISRKIVQEKKYNLDQNYPNPFNPITTIRYKVMDNSFVQIIVYDILGREIQKIVNEKKDAGNHEIKFSAENFASGIYIYKIICRSIDGKNTFIDSKKMVLIK